MSIEDEMITKIAKQMQVDIDQHIIDEIMREDVEKRGWTKIPHERKARLSEIIEWIRKNASGDYKLIHNQWWFENSSDAMHFIIRWL